MNHRSFYRSSIIISCLVVVILLLIAPFSARAEASLNGSAREVLYQGNDKPDKVTLCHATGSASNPYVEITVSHNAATEGHGHDGHADDIIPAPAEGCPAELWLGGVAPAQGQPAATLAPGSPDRRWIAFNSNRDGNWEIYIASTDGTTQQRMIHTTAQNSGPVWSPTGQFIAFESNRDGHWELYLVDVTAASKPG